jgi:hypothetical protein
MLAVAVGGALACVLCSGGVAGVAAHPIASRASAVLTFSLGGGGRRIPNSFFGVSIEYKELARYEAEGPLFDRAIALIRPEDGSRMLLRVGGKSADHVYWHAAKATPPQWVSFITTRWLTSLAQLARRDRLRVMLDLNLAVHAPALEAAFAAAAKRALPPSTLAGFDIGNEPDLYKGQPQLQKQRVPGTIVGPHWTDNYNASDYRRDYEAYARALRSAVPKVALGAPELVSSDPTWLAAVQGLGKVDPRFLTVHRYPGSTCFHETSLLYPTISTLLSEQATEGLAGTVVRAVAYAHAHDQQLRVDEINSISCGGHVGVANGFVTALWAPDALLEMVRAGVDGVNWEVRPGTLTAPFIAQRDAIRALPEMYGLAVVAQMTRHGSFLLGSTLSQPASSHVKAWAVAYAGAMRVLVINKGPGSATVNLRLGVQGHAFLKRLLAPRIDSVTGVTFGGQTIGPDGRWHGRLKAPPVPDQNGNYLVTVPGHSAAMVTVFH